MTQIQAFRDLNLSDTVLQAVAQLGFTEPSPIQKEVIPLILSGADVVGQAQTGTGKTAAYGMPSISIIGEIENTTMLVITPTRELALQVSEELGRIGKPGRIKTATIYGGGSFSKQIDDVRRGAKVIVGTPGRLLDLLSTNRLKGFAPSIVVLDEADEMLNMGFLEDVQSIFKFLPEDRQTLLFSATMSPAIQKLIKTLLKEPRFVKVTAAETTNKDIEQQFYVIEDHEREQAVMRLMDTASPEKAVIFCKTRRDADKLSDTLIKRGYLARALHGEMEQNKREEVVSQFRKGGVRLLVATDVAARGLNVPDISHVFNYHMPFDAESYVHRIGRTARAGRSGVAMSLVTPREMRELDNIRHKMGTSIKQHFLPSKTQVVKAHAMRLVSVVRAQPKCLEAKDVLSALTADMDLQEVAERLLSQVMNKQDVAGPETIGLSKEQLERIASRRGGPDSGSRSGRRPFRSHGNDRFRRSAGASAGGGRRQAR